MSSDGYFDGDDDFDDSALAQLDAIEAAHLSPGKSNTQLATTSGSGSSRPAPPRKENSFYEFSFDMDEGDLAQLDDFIEDAYEGKAQPVAGPSKPFARTTSSNTVQTTLFGERLPPSTSSGAGKAKGPMERTKSSQRNVFGKQPAKTKKWDQTAFAKSGIKQGKSKAKGKGKAGDGDEEEEEAVEFEQFPAPFVSIGPPPPMKLVPDLLEAKHWIFPINRPKRDYQFNIIRHCLFENTLVALPTGLGKTFIAGVVMMNYYRWFPEGKVIFVAPTKPLVSQQINACHETCGIPAYDSAEMNGEVSVVVRQRYWKEKRVFFMTPQTLVNDLVKGVCDAQDLVLLVIDEAHRGSGDYAYNQAIRFMMAKNPHFRVLALTATPGNKPEAVQALIDGLHISHIEIRNEESLDLRAYTHKKDFIPHLIKANPSVAKIRDLLANVMSPMLKRVQQAGVLFGHDAPVSLHPYKPQAAMQKLLPHQRHFYSPLSWLSQLARAMWYLLCGTIEASFAYLQEISHEPEKDAESGKKKGKKLKDDPNFRILMQELEMQRAVGFSLHPKMEKMIDILVQHFGKSDAASDDTRVMVFSSFRPVVDRLVEELNKHKPLLRPARFIGQGTDKNGNKGLSQKEQLQVIEKFTSGEFNILVATCIGEEGLDIGELDMTICYDSDKTPTRMIQRFGRTGRKREGTIHALLAEEREELNVEKAEAAYREVQKLISRGEMYELYSDVERLLPDHVKPECVEKVVEIQPYIREKDSPKRKKGPATQGTKRKRNDDIGRNIPDGASNGFVSVRDLVTKGSKKPKKTALAKDFDACGQDDETDEELESGRVIAPRRTQSASAGTSVAKPKPKAKLRKSATLGGSKAPKSRRKKVEEPSLSQFSKQGNDDSDDMDLEQGSILPRTQKQIGSKSSKSPVVEIADNTDFDEYPTTVQIENIPRQSKLPRIATPPEPDPSPSRQEYASILELTDSEHGHASLSPISIRQSSPSPACRTPSKYSSHEDMGWLVDDDDDDLGIEIVHSSPVAPKRVSPFDRLQMGDESIEISRPTASNRLRNSWDASSTLVDDSIEIIQTEGDPTFASAISKSKGKARQIHSRSSSLEVLASKDANIQAAYLSPARRPSNVPQTFSSPNWPSSSPLYPTKDQMSMPPPALPGRFLAPALSPVHDTPEPTYPVRPLQAKRRRITFAEESPVVDAPSPSQRRLRRIESTPVRTKVRTKSKRTKPSLLARDVNPLFDGEAGHSGDEVSEGRSGSEDDEESESDRLFIRDSPLTQGTQSYEQTQIYRQSLMTQAGGGLGFSKGPIRARPFGRIDGPTRDYGLPSSSPPPPDEHLDNYELGTFVVDDEDEISYDQDLSMFIE